MKKYPHYSGFPHYKTYESFVDGIAERFGDRIAISYKKKPRDKNLVNISYNQLARDVHALSASLINQGLSGVHCALVGGISYEWICLYLALQMIGSVAVPLDREWSESDILETAEFADCTHIFADLDIAENFKSSDMAVTSMGVDSEVSKLIKEGDFNETLPELADPKALSLLVFTSGTTGKGKGVMLSQFGILTDIYYGMHIIKAGKKCIVTLPPHHTYGSTIGIISLLYSGSNIYLSSGLKYIASEMKEFKPDFMVLVPLYIESFHRKINAALKSSGKEVLVGRLKKLSNALLKAKIDMRRLFFKQILSSFGGELDFLVSGGAPLRPELIDDFEAIGIKILNGYGITECSPIISVNRNDYIVKGSVGEVIPNMDIMLDNQNADKEGEICVRGDNVMLGYYKMPEESAAVIDKDGYFHTGDIGKIVDGTLFITGRIKNLIILANGKNVYPEEIESEIASIPGVLETVVYEGVSKRGASHNQIVAEIFPDAEALANISVNDPESYFKEAVAVINKNAPSYKKVGVVKVRNEEFPKNTLRKITRFKMDMTID